MTMAGTGENRSPASNRAFDDVEARLIAELRLYPRRAPAGTALRDAICDYVEQLRDTGARPEEVLISFKQLLERVMRPSVRLSEETRPLVSECISAYFRTP